MILLVLPLFAFAQPNLNLLANQEWKGECRKFIGNEHSMSVYSVKPGNQLVWTVQSFKDPKCKQAFNFNRTTLKCATQTREGYARCKQTKFESSRDGKAWTEEKPVQQAGHAITMELQVKAKPIEKNKKVQLTTLTSSRITKNEVLQPVKTGI